MTLRKAHGAARRCGATLVVETLPADEQPQGVARPEPANSRATRDARGRFKRPTDPTEAAAARELGRIGGKARKGWRAAADGAQIGTLAAAPGWRAYALAAEALADGHLADVRARVGGGEVGAGLRALIRCYALQIAASRWASEQAAARVDSDAKLAASLFTQSHRWVDAARSTLLTVHELAAKMAPKRAPRPGDLDQLLGPRRKT